MLKYITTNKKKITVYILFSFISIINNKNINKERNKKNFYGGKQRLWILYERDSEGAHLGSFINF